MPHASLLGSTSCTHTGCVTRLLQLIRNPQPQQGCFRVNTCSPSGTGMCMCDSSAIKETSLAWCLLLGNPVDTAKASWCSYLLISESTQMLALHLLLSQGPSQQKEADSYQAPSFTPLLLASSALVPTWNTCRVTFRANLSPTQPLASHSFLLNPTCFQVSYLIPIYISQIHRIINVRKNL